MAKSLKQYVFDRLNDGKNIEVIWRDSRTVGANLGWNYARRISRDWARERAKLIAALDAAARDSGFL